MNSKFWKSCVFTFFLVEIALADKPAGKKEKSWKDKDILDMTDADMERLLDQWEVKVVLLYSVSFLTCFSLFIVNVLMFSTSKWCRF